MFRDDIILLSGPWRRLGSSVLRAMVGGGFRPKALLVEERLELSGLRWLLERLLSVYRFEGPGGVMRGILRRTPPLSFFLEQTDNSDEEGLEKFARSLDVPVHRVKDHNSDESRELIKELRPELMVLGGAGLIKEEIFSIPRLGTLNVHPGSLPAYRGLYPLPWALFHNTRPGVSVHFVDRGVDTGVIAASRPLLLNEGDTIESLQIKALRVGAEMLVEVLEKLETGRLERIRQTKVEGKRYRSISWKEVKRARQNLERMIKETADNCTTGEGGTGG